ncbi:MAG: TonB-dependent siderophore receptor [Aquabacterium sp.]|nr:MAG: TonB-dependent siderophore receptor [Aquabacterium sp.]
MSRTIHRPRPAALAAAAVLSLARPTFAADAATTPEKLPTESVRAKAIEEQANGPVDGYRAKRSATATKTDTPLNETPESITVVTREEMLDQGANGVQDALNYAAGVRSNAYGLDSRSDGTRIRGTAPDEYEDGLRRLFNWYTSNTRVEPYALERIEVLRGPAALMYGQGSTGGLINTVSKRPQAETQREVGVQLGSWNRRQVQADLTGALSEDGEWLYRLVALKRKADTQVDHVRDDRTVLAPSLTWKPSASTSWTLLALWQQDRSGSTSQFFPWEGVATPTANGRRIPTHTFTGDPDWDRYDSDRASLTSVFEHHFDSGWTFKQNLRSSYNKVDYRSLYGDSFGNDITPAAPGTYGSGVSGLFGRFADASLTKVRMLAADQNLEGTVQTGPLTHRVLLGLDVVEYKQASASGIDYPTYYGGSVPLIDVYAPHYGGFTPPTLTANPLSYQRQLGLYLQDQVRLDRWTLVAGLRRDRAASGTEDAPAERHYATSRRLGLIHAFDNGWSPYVNYSESFTPVAAIDAQIFKPQRGRQVEAGVKYQPADGSLLFTAAAYKLRESNRVVSPTATTYAQIGETRTQGLELEFKSSVTRAIDVVANYTYTDIDQQLEQLPRNQASFWGKWRFAVAGIEGFSAGAGLRWMSSFRDVAHAYNGSVTSTAPETPAVTLVDAMVAWENARWRAALNVTNLSDKVYYSTCLSRGDCWYGARRSVVGSLTYRF